MKNAFPTREKIEYKTADILRRIYVYIHRSSLRNKRFSIISNNCWGGIVYDDFHLPYMSPFVNMYIHAPCYLKMLKNLDKYLSLELVTTHISKYNDSKTLGTRSHYPIGVLGDVEIHFVHYKDPIYALKKWNERIRRLDMSNLLVTMSERDKCNDDLIVEFDTLPFKNKICFTRHDLNLRSTIHLSRYSNRKELPPADQLAGLTYWKASLVDRINNLN